MRRVLDEVVSASIVIIHHDIDEIMEGHFCLAGSSGVGGLAEYMLTECLA
jgi:hypothetical protein